MLFLGAKSDLPLKLLKSGYGTKLTGFITVVDEDAELLQKLEQLVKEEASKDKTIQDYVNSNRIMFKSVNNYREMKAVCKQSTIDSIVDYGGLGKCCSII